MMVAGERAATLGCYVTHYCHYIAITGCQRYWLLLLLIQALLKIEAARRLLLAARALIADYADGWRY